MYGPCKKKATNNHAEIQSAYIAIQQAEKLGITKLRVNTDSKVVYDAMTDLIPKWKATSWHSLYDGKVIADRRYFEKLVSVIAMNPQMIIEFNHIPGHSGNVHHNEADHLAKKGAERHCNFNKLHLNHREMLLQFNELSLC